MRTLLMAALLLSLLACSKDEKRTCSLETIDNKSYTGKIGVCNGQSGQFLEFDGTASLSLLDSTFTIHLFSIDSLHAFNQFFDATGTCETPDDDTNWNFSDIPTHYALGSVYGNGKYLLLDLQKGPCGTDQYFLGAIQN